MQQPISHDEMFEDLFERKTHSKTLKDKVGDFSRKSEGIWFFYDEFVLKPIGLLCAEAYHKFVSRILPGANPNEYRSD